MRIAALLFLTLLLGACETRPVNPPIAKVDLDSGYRYTTRERYFQDKENLVVLAFSGGGTRAAAFSYGVLEALREVEVSGAGGKRERLLDQVDVITGVSGGSFTALAYGLYGDKLFGSFETAFLKRDVEGELIARFLNPGNWGSFWFSNWGRSEMAAQYYDEILFHGATFADLNRGKGPMILSTATDIATGVRFGFNQASFDVICSDLGSVPLSRAVAASSAVPLLLSPVTLENYGGTCNYEYPPALKAFSDPKKAPRPAARAVRHLKELEAFRDGKQRPYLHLVDGGLADNVGMRAVLDTLEEVEALYMLGVKSPVTAVHRVVVIIVDAKHSPPTGWDRSANPPSDVSLVVRASTVPISHDSYDSVELLRDMVAQWKTTQRIAELTKRLDPTSPELAKLVSVPNFEVYAIDVSFSRLADASERAYLDALPTTFKLPPEAVDRLRAAAGTILRGSEDFQRLYRDTDARTLQ